MTPQNIEDLKTRCQEEVGDEFVILDSAKRPEFFTQRSENAIGGEEAILEDNHLHELYGNKGSRSVFLWSRKKREAAPGTAHIEKRGADVDND